jgi:hypothetical protein
MRIARRRGGALRFTMATVLVLALIAAPVCGSVCAAGACANAKSQTGDCHEGGMVATGAAAESNVTAVKSCNLSELPVARLSETVSQVKARNQQTALAVPPRLAYVSVKPEIAHKRCTSGGEDSPPELISGSSTVLRI